MSEKPNKRRGIALYKGEVRGKVKAGALLRMLSDGTFERTEDPDTAHAFALMKAHDEQITVVLLEPMKVETHHE